MREILFRGKRKSDGEWIYGNLLQTDDGIFIIQNYAPFEGIGKYEVIQETVCQYTGLTDKNGRKIWEDDIIRYGGKLFQIVWVLGCALFSAHPLKENRVSPCLNVGTMKNAEVVGNIFDNPELIGGKEE